MSAEGLRFTLKVDGILEMATAVVSFRLVQRHSVPFVLEVGIASGLFDLTAADFLEKNAVLTVWQGDVAQRYVSGLVSDVALGENNGWQMRYHLSIRPPLWRAGLRQNFRIFQQQDIKTISALLLNENGVTDWLPLFYEEHPAREWFRDEQHGRDFARYRVEGWRNSAGTPASTQQPAVLEALADKDEDTCDSDGPDDDDKYNGKFHFTDDDGIPYANTEYIAYLANGAQKKGLTNKEGETERFISDTMDSVGIKLILDFQNN